MPQENPRRPDFEPGRLWARLEAVTDRALESGALLSIPTESEAVPDGGVTFLVRVVSSLARKDAERRKQAGMGDPTRGGAGAGADSGADTAPRPNPFLPYDEDLYVADVGEHHVAVLNKFNVVPHHLLLITRRFEHQTRLLTEADFVALWRCLAEYESLGFYNGGEIAGASQPHKHLQLVPLPMAPGGPAFPLEPALVRGPAPGLVGASADLPFVHALVRLPPGFESDPESAGRQSLTWYRDLLCRAGRPVHPGPHGDTVDPYNLLVTRRHLLLVPRRAEYVQGVSFNALAFAGTLLVRRRDQLDVLRRTGCFGALQAVAEPLPRK